MANGTVDFEQMINQWLARLKQRAAGGRRGPSIPKVYLLVVALLIWLATGIYFVAPDEAGVVVRFGKAIYTSPPGPHWHLPWPMERVYKPKVTQIQKVEVGFRTISVGPPARYRDVPTEGLMLTGDENIVNLEFIIQFKIKDPIHYLFRVRNPVETLKDAAESAMRETVGKKEIDDALTTGKGLIQNESQELLQQILDQYEAGIQVVTVKLQDVDPPEAVNDAFKDVINAQQDKERLINEAKGYRNDIIPKARGAAAQKLNEAEAYKQALVKRASGEAQRFKEVLKEYRQAKFVTRKRLYLETMEKILPNTQKIIVDESVRKNVLPYLPLNELGKARTTGKPPAKGGR